MLTRTATTRLLARRLRNARWLLGLRGCNPVLAIELMHFLDGQIRFVAKRGIWKLDNVVDGSNGYRYVGCHSREELHLGVIEVHNRVVGDDVLHCGCVHAHLADDSVKHLFGKRVYLEIRSMSGADLSYVAFVSLGVHVHLCQVL